MEILLGMWSAGPRIKCAGSRLEIKKMKNYERRWLGSHGIARIAAK